MQPENFLLHIGNSISTISCANFQVAWCICTYLCIMYQTRQSAQWDTYTPDQRYRQLLKSTKYVALTLEMAIVCYML